MDPDPRDTQMWIRTRVTVYSMSITIGQICSTTHVQLLQWLNGKEQQHAWVMDRSSLLRSNPSTFKLIFSSSSVSTGNKNYQTKIPFCAFFQLYIFVGLSSFSITILFFHTFFVTCPLLQGTRIIKTKVQKTRMETTKTTKFSTKK